MHTPQIYQAMKYLSLDIAAFIEQGPHMPGLPAFRISLFDSSHFCVPLEVLYHLLTIRGDCYA